MKKNSKIRRYKPRKFKRNKIKLIETSNQVNVTNTMKKDHKKILMLREEWATG